MKSNLSAVETTEELFHDKWAETARVDKIKVNELFESPSCPENQQILEWMGDIKGKKILEVGCGLGEASVYFAKKGADVTASDISSGMLDVASKLATKHQVSIKTIHISANNLSLIPDASFDIIYAANLLHHVEISSFLQETKKKLKPGGEFYSWDPIHYNPIIQVYRRMATKVRTEDEHPLKKNDLDTIRQHFDEVEVRFFWYSALLIFIKFYLLDRIHPNQARYWKKIIDDARALSGSLRVLHYIDQLLFARVPFVKWLGWNIVVRCKIKSSS